MKKIILAALSLLICLTFTLSVKSASTDRRGIVRINGNQAATGQWGNYYALIVGINNYRQWPTLQTAVNDATALKNVLIDRYGFKKKNVVFRIDNEATRETINKDLRALAAGLKENDNLLIYFAGHGQLDDLTGGGYWIPVEGKLKTTSSWISHDTIKNILCSEKVRGKNIVVVADSCYSGTLLRGGPSPLSVDDGQYENKLLQLASRRSRQVITSGGVEPVADGGRDGHSLFAYYFLTALKENRRPVIDLENLIHTRVWKNVTEIGGYRPNIGRLKTPMDEDGQFVLASGAGIIYGPGPQKEQKAMLSVEADVTGATVFVDGRHLGQTPLSDTGVDSGERIVLVEKEGYKPYSKRIKFEKGRTVSLMITLDREQAPVARLFVDTSPENADVKIMNITPKFFQGMTLAPDTYHVRVSANGYKTQDLRVELGQGEDKRLDVRLEAVVTAPAGGHTDPSGGKKFTNRYGMSFVYIEPGTFTMGSPSNEPQRGSDEKQHQVTLTKGYYMQTTEVTQGQWKQVMGSNPSYFKNCGDNCPVEQVSWDDAQAFIKKLNSRDGGGYRLPSEAEWEYACRAGTSTPFSFGRCLSTDQANYDGNYPLTGCSKGKYRQTTTPAASFASNDWGLYDMHGNVYEWCQDWYGKYTNDSTDPVGSSGGSSRVLRGGCWSISAEHCRSANRSYFSPDDRNGSIGFRLVRSPGQH